MKLEDAVTAMHVIESQCDGSPESIAMATELTIELVEGDPTDFWQRFFERKSSVTGSGRDQATRFISEFGMNATFGDMREFLKRDGDAK
jgi:hypothetical protein